MNMKDIIDIHSHILPHVDDGCKSYTEALKMIDLYRGQNVKTVICTPHYGVYGIPGTDIDDMYNQLSYDASCKGVILLLGNEILFDRFTLLHVRRGLARTLNSSKYILVEFDPWGAGANADYIFNCMSWLAQSEYKPILAHAERYPALQVKEGIYHKLVRAGVKLQVNAYDIYNNPDEREQKVTRRLLRNHLVSFIGSDAHGERRPPLLLDGVSWIYDNCREDYADAVVHDNAENLLLGHKK